MPTTQFFVNERAPEIWSVSSVKRHPSMHTISEESDAMEDVLDDNRLEHVQLINRAHQSAFRLGKAEMLRTSKCPLEPAMLTVVLLPIT
jgi:hypothetical protein